MRNFESDIMGRLVAKTFKTPHDMKLHVTLIDPANGQSYTFMYGDWGLTPDRAILKARADLSHMWSHQNV